MQSVETGWLLTTVGILVELGVTVLITVLVLTLRHEARRYAYLRLWTAAWLAFTAAVVLVAARHDLVPGLVVGPPGASSVLAPFLHALYQIGKLLFLGFLLLGAISAARGGSPSRRTVVATILVAVAYGLPTGLVGTDLDAVVARQALAAVPCFGYSAWLLARVPSERRGRGVGILVAALTAHALLWVVYLTAFGLGLPTDHPVGEVLALFTGNNSYIDAVLAFTLGLGMVVMVIEESHLDADRRQRAQLEEIARSERRLAEVLRAASEGIVTLDADRRITALNPAAERMFGIGLDAVGSLFDGLIERGAGEALWADLARSADHPEPRPDVSLRREVTGLRLGQPFPLELAVASVAEAGGRGYVVVARDLTEQRYEQAERERLQQQVAHAARLEAMGRMVSGVAHELNNPLTAILAFGQDMLSTARSPEDREALSVIVDQADRCRVIVGDLLTFARSRREERRRVAPEDLIHRVLRVFQRESASRGVELVVQVAPDLPPIDIDPVGVEQVVTNLLTNAFQATPAGGQVGLSVRARAAGLEIVVEDTGHGIPPAVLAQIFEPFFTTKDPDRGTGLGLSVSHSIVQQHGGAIRAENREGDQPGARFTVTLPFVERRSASRSGPNPPGHRPPDSPAPEAAVAPAPVRPAGRRVLLVDDEDAIRTAMRRALERRGWVVDEAVDGREALLKLDLGGRPGPYDAVVTDLRMPGISGIEVCERLGAMHPALAARTVVITGDSASPAVATFLATAGKPFLQKPFDLRALAELLERVVTEPHPVQ